MPVLGLPTALESSINDLLFNGPASSWRVSGRGNDVTVVIRWTFGCGSPVSDKTLDYDDSSSTNQQHRNYQTSRQAGMRYRSRTPLKPYTFQTRRHGATSPSPSVVDAQQCTPDSGRDSITVYPKHELDLFGEDSKESCQVLPQNQQTSPVPYYMMRPAANSMVADVISFPRDPGSSGVNNLESQNIFAAHYQGNNATGISEDLNDSDSTDGNGRVLPAIKENSETEDIRSGIRHYLLSTGSPPSSNQESSFQPLPNRPYQPASAPCFHTTNTCMFGEGLETTRPTNVQNRSSEPREVLVTGDSSASANRRNFQIFGQQSSLSDDTTRDTNHGGFDPQTHRSPDCSNVAMTTDEERDEAAGEADVDIVVCSSESDPFEEDSDVTRGDNFHGWEVLDMRPGEGRRDRADRPGVGSQSGSNLS